MEGLFTPEQLETPFKKARVLKALTRSGEVLGYAWNVFPTGR